LPRRRRKRDTDAPAEPRVRPAEQLLIDAVPRLAAERVLCTTRGRANFAVAFAEEHVGSRVTCHFLDVQRADEAREAITGAERVEIVCAADLPVGEFDLAAFPFGRNDEFELTRETIQTAHDRLIDGGRMVLAIDDDKDARLHDELRKRFDKVTREPERKRGTRYLVTKRGPLAKRKEFGSEFTFRDGDREVRAFTRPGVFSHRKLDPAARALLQAVSVEPGDRILDFGCGAGTVGLALAGRAEGTTLLAVDSNARAVECTARGAELNGLDNVMTRLGATALAVERDTFDLVVASPPYSAKGEVSEVFAAAVTRAVQPEGLVAIVTRQPDWYADRLVESFRDVSIADVRSFSIVAATRRR
jgi:16S rRNA G1207 methylase RsmC